MDAATLDFWVLHSPYPDGGWRGLEKCVCHQSGSPRLFREEIAARFYAHLEGLEEYFVPVKVCLSFPWVGEKVKED